MLSRIFTCAASRSPATRLLAPTLAVAGAVLAPGHALACGSSLSPSYTIAAVSPSSGSTAVARDAGIIISAAPSFPDAGPTAFADVQLIDVGSDALVPIRDVSWYSFGSSEVTMAVHPLEPLASQRDYRVEVTPLAPEAGTIDARIFTSSFTTSDALLEPLVLSGEIELSLRAGEADVLGDCSRCGGECAPVGKRPALLADVRLPAPSGGQGVYRGILHFSDHTPVRVNSRDVTDYERSEAEPHEIHLTQGVALEPGQTLSLEQEVVEEAFAYAGCFTFMVWDPAGHTAQTSACLPSLAPEDIRALSELETPLELAADDDEADEQIQVATSGARDERSTALGGCALGTNPASGAPSGLALLAALLLLRRRP